MKKTIKMLFIAFCFLTACLTVQKKSTVFAAAAEGKCGAGAAWTYEAGVLTISGTGDMENYSTKNPPAWSPYVGTIKKVVVDEGISAIGTHAFLNCSAMTEISLPSSLKKIGGGAFGSCAQLEEVLIPENVTEIASGSFVNCKKLTKVSAPGARTVAQYAFQNTAIKSFTLSKNVRSFSALAFLETPIESYEADAENAVYTSNGGVIFSKDQKTLVAFPCGKQGSAYAVPQAVTTIGSYAFYKNRYLTRVDMGKNVSALKEGAFDGCQSFTSVTIPDSIRSVGDYAYFGCPNLTEVTFGKGLKKTSYQMFRNCPSLKTVTFGSALQELGQHTFAYCNALENVVLPKNIKKIGEGAFGECRMLKSFRSDGLANVPYSAFWNCKNLKAVTLNEGLKDISRCAFYGCDALRKISLPKSLTFVHSLAFPKTTAVSCKNKKLSRYGTNGYRRIQKVSITGTRDYKKAYQLLKQVNARRRKKGLPELTMNKGLLESAMNRAAEITVCFSHTRPDGSDCAELNEQILAENIAARQDTAKNVLNAWMNSKEHKDNIMSSKFSSIGIGCYYNNGTYYWVQCFGKEKGKTCKQPKNASKKQKLSLATDKFTDAETGTAADGGAAGSQKTYKYAFGLYLKSTQILERNTTTAILYVRNAGNRNLIAKLNPAGVKWSVDKTKYAQINKKGEITGVKAGPVKITGTLGSYKVREKMKVLVNNTPEP